MRFLIDNALSAEVARRLREAGYDATHVRDYGLQDAEDSLILGHARFEDRTMVSADSDFAILLALSLASKPSFILFREPAIISAQDQVRILLGAFPCSKAA